MVNIEEGQVEQVIYKEQVMYHMMGVPLEKKNWKEDWVYWEKS